MWVMQCELGAAEGRRLGGKGGWWLRMRVRFGRESLPSKPHKKTMRSSL